MLRIAFATCLSLLVLAGGGASSVDPAWSSQVRRSLTSSVASPDGVYVKLDIGTALEAFLPAPPPPPLPYPKPPSVSRLHSLFGRLVRRVLGNPAISGIRVGEHWDDIQLSGPSYPYEPVGGYDWSYLDEVFTIADELRKPVQVQITPGVDSPQALLASIPSCNTLFDAGSKVKREHCGTIVFPNPPEPGNSDSDILPLPWNTRYNTAWDGFLRRLQARYKRNPEFAAIAIDGPVDASPEMILPTSANTHRPEVDDMWATLIKHSFPHRSSYDNTDAAFVEVWDKTIDFYETLFSGVTLFLTPDSGSDLPDLGPNLKRQHGDELYTRDCAASLAATDPHSALYKELTSCEAKTEILSYFLRAHGPNARATFVGGMTASSPTTLQPGTSEVAGDIGIPGIKLLTGLQPPPPVAIGAGADFDFPVSSKKKEKEGCPTYPKKRCQPLSVVDAAANVLEVFFDHTPEGSSFGGQDGDGHVDFLGVPYLDVLYAETHPCAQLQDLLDAASEAMTGKMVECTRNSPKRATSQHQPAKRATNRPSRAAALAEQRVAAIGHVVEHPGCELGLGRDPVARRSVRTAGSKPGAAVCLVGPMAAALAAIATAARAAVLVQGEDIDRDALFSPKTEVSWRMSSRSTGLAAG